MRGARTRATGNREPGATTGPQGHRSRLRTAVQMAIQDSKRETRKQGSSRLHRRFPGAPQWSLGVHRAARPGHHATDAGNKIPSLPRCSYKDTLVSGYGVRISDQGMVIN